MAATSTLDDAVDGFNANVGQQCQSSVEVVDAQLDPIPPGWYRSVSCDLLAGATVAAHGPAQAPRDQVVALVAQLIEALGGPGGSPAIALAGAAEADSELAQIHHADSAKRFAALVHAVAEAAPDVDAELGASALAGAVVYRRLVLGDALRTADATPSSRSSSGSDPRHRGCSS